MMRRGYKILCFLKKSAPNRKNRAEPAEWIHIEKRLTLTGASLENGNVSMVFTPSLTHLNRLPPQIKLILLHSEVRDDV